MSVCVYEKTWPTWSEPLTVGGGVSMEKISSRVFERSKAYTPDSSHRLDHLSSSPSRTGLSGTPAGRWVNVMPGNAIQALRPAASPFPAAAPPPDDGARGAGRAGQRVMRAGSLTPAAPVSTWPANRRRKPVSASDFTVRSYQRLVERRSTVCRTVAPALTLKVWAAPP
ncbi:hypothetical protein SALBM135S_08121 [Streptomyces alboniger]